MPRFKATIRYNGSRYLGFQIQPQSPTIQEVIENKLFQILREQTRITPSGRTDAGVHALKQIFHFDLKSENGLLRISQSDFIYRMNCILPDDIFLDNLTKCDDNFHARKLATEKIYAYWIFFDKAPHPFLNSFSWQIGYDLDLKLMQDAAKLLTGTHDFSAFCASDSQAKSKVRELFKIDFTTEAPSHFWNTSQEKWLKISFHGKGFLKQMVRNLVGTLVEVGRHKIASNKIRKMLETGDRQLAGATAPAQGLHLVDILYKTS